MFWYGFAAGFVACMTLGFISSLVLAWWLFKDEPKLVDAVSQEE